jgi:signal transduction histidine kinase
MNLLTNAFKFTIKGSIKIYARLKYEPIKLNVKKSRSLIYFEEIKQ